MDSSAVTKRAFFYSPLSFLHGYQKHLSENFISNLIDETTCGHVTGVGDKARLFIRRLDWDSRYFNCPFYRIEFADWDEDVANPAHALAQTLSRLKAELSMRDSRYYLFSEIPSEDLPVLQAMGLSGARLIETRVTYFHDDLQRFEWPVRSKVRPATDDDIADLRKTAIQSRNSFDRYHADPFFSEAAADEYMATYVENSIKGFADIVLVPAEGPRAPGAFFTADFKPIKAISPDFKLGRIPLVAIGKERRGWHVRLLTEMTYLFKDRGARVACMTTQSTNRAVIRNCEKLGYRYGRCTHVFSTYSNEQK